MADQNRNITFTITVLTKNVQQALKSLQKEIELINSKLNKTTPGTKAYSTLSQRADMASQSVKRLDAQMKTLNATGKKTGGTFLNITRYFTGLLGVMTAVRGIREGVNQFLDFNAAIQKNQALLSGSYDSMLDLADVTAKLREQALYLGQTTVYTATEVAGLQTALIKLGFTADDIEYMSEPILNLAAALDVAIERAGEVVGSVARQFGIYGQDVTLVADLIAQASVKSANDLETLAASMKFVGSTANAVGLEVNDTVAILNTLANIGLKGSVAGTALNNALIELNKNSSKAVQTFGKTVGSMDDLQEILGIINERGYGVAELFDLMNIRSARAVLALSKQTEELQKQKEAMQDVAGAATAMAKIQLDQIKGDITILTSNLTKLAIETLQYFNKRLRETVENINGWVDTTREIVTWIAQHEKFAKALGITLKVLISLLIGYRIQQSALIKNLFSFVKGIKLANIAAWTFKGTMQSLGAVLKNNAIGLIITAFTVLLPLIKKARGGFKSYSEETQNNIVKLKEQQNELLELREALKDTNKTQGDRIKLIQELQSKYPDLLKNIDAEKVKNEELAKAIGDSSEALKEQIRLQILGEEVSKNEEKQNKLIRKQIELEQKLTNVRRIYNTMVERNRDAAFVTPEQIQVQSQYASQIARIERQLRNNADSQEKYGERIEQGNTVIDETKDKIDDLLGLNTELTEEQKEQIKVQNELIQAKFNEALAAKQQAELLSQTTTDVEAYINARRKALKLEDEYNQLIIERAGEGSQETETATRAIEANQKKYDELERLENEYKVKQIQNAAALLELDKQNIQAFYEKQEQALRAELELVLSNKQISVQQRYEQEQALLKKIEENEKKYQEEKLKREIQGIKLANDEALLASKILRQRYDLQLKLMDSIDARRSNQRDTELQALQIETDKIEAQINERYIKEKQVIDVKRKEGKLSAAEYEQRLEEIEQSASLERLNNTAIFWNKRVQIVRYYKEQMEDELSNVNIDIAQADANINPTRGNQIKLLEEQEKQKQQILDRQIVDAKYRYGEEADIVKKLEEYKLKVTEEYAKKRRDVQMENAQMGVQMFSEMINQIGELVATQRAIEEEELARTFEQRAETIQTTYDDQLTALGLYGKESSELTAAQNRRLNEINKKRAAEEKKLEEQREKEALKLKKDYADKEFAIKVAQIGASTALAIMQVWANNTLPYPFAAVFNGIMTGLIAATGAVQIGAAKKERDSIKSLGRGGSVTGPSHANGGVKFAVGGGVELEGDEWVVNKRTMSNPRLASIVKQANDMGNNGQYKQFAMGGSLNPKSVINEASQISEESIQNIVQQTVAGIAMIPVVNVATETTTTSDRVRRVQNSISA